VSDPTWTARPYQREAVAHLLRTPMSGLLMPPGTGKTACVYAAFHVLKKRGLVDRLVVLSPLRPAYQTWPDENAKWNFGFDLAVLHGPKKDELLAGHHDVCVLNYEGLGWFSDSWHEYKGRSRRHRAERVWLVPDESQRLKHTDTERFKILEPLLECFSRRTILTGTFAPNGLEDLFGQVKVVDLGERFGPYITWYRRNYFNKVGYGGYHFTPLDEAEKKIYKKLDGIFYVVDEKVLKLPKLVPNEIYVELPSKARALYRQLEDEFVAVLRKTTITAANAGVMTQKLRQLCNGGLYDNEKRSHRLHDAKMEAMADLVEELGGNPLFVGYEFTSDGLELQRRLKKLGIDAPVVRGGMSMAVTNRLLAEFNDGRHRVLVCQSGSVALGLNMQAACHTVARLGLGWDLEIFKQFAKRVHRSGQKKSVMDHRVIARGTIEDEVVWPLLQRKDATQDDLVKAIKARYLR